jgi:hypothetical protein
MSSRSGSRVLHRVLVPRGAMIATRVGAVLTPDQTIGHWDRPLPPIRIDAASQLRCRAADLPGLMVAPAGVRVEDGGVLARASSGREVVAPASGWALTASRDGSILFVPAGAAEMIIAHVRGRVRAIEEGAVLVEVPGARLPGIAGSGTAVHGELMLAVSGPDDELRATAIDTAFAGKILVGGSRASAEALTRARAIGVAGIVLGGILDKELREFEAAGQRRRDAGGASDPFGLLLLEGFGKVGFDPLLFGWLSAQAGRMASLSGADRLLYVYDATAPPVRRALPQVGERVIGCRRPFQGRTGVLVAILDDLHAAPNGVVARMALVRQEEGRLVVAPLADLEAMGPPAGR